MHADRPSITLSKRLAYAFAGLVVGDLLLLLYLLQSALWTRSFLRAEHIGAPAEMIPLALQVFFIYAVSSVVGWLIIGVPTVLLLPARVVTRWSWYVKLLLGAVLGPLALFVILFLLGRGHVDFSGTFRSTGALWVYSIVVSTVSFLVYAFLLAKQTS
jgi:hypothetical protein